MSAPAGLVAINGELRPRRKLWVLANHPITCAFGHYIRDTGSHVLTCTDCRVSVWVFHAAKGRLFIADISSDEAHQFREREQSVDEILRYIGAA